MFRLWLRVLRNLLVQVLRNICQLPSHLAGLEIEHPHSVAHFL